MRRRNWRAPFQIPVIASGGLAGIEDVERLLSPAYAIIAGAIAGRALYDGRLDVKTALDLISKAIDMTSAPPSWDAI